MLVSFKSQTAAYRTPGVFFSLIELRMESQVAAEAKESGPAGARCSRESSEKTAGQSEWDKKTFEQDYIS